MAFFLYFLEIWPLLLWKFGLESYSWWKIHWCLMLQSAVLWIKTSYCVEHQNNAPTSAIIRRLYAVRCFDSLNSRSQRQRPMDLWSGITSKTKLLQKNWTHLQNLCIKVDQMAYSKSLEIFMRQEWRNFDMCYQQLVGDLLQSVKSWIMMLKLTLYFMHFRFNISIKIFRI